MKNDPQNHKSAARIINVLVISSYAIKSAAKAVFGLLVLTPKSMPLVIDAAHSFVDILEHIAISWGGHFARKEPDEQFPIGRKPVLDIIGMLIGISILSLSLKCFKDAVIGGDYEGLTKDNIAIVAMVFILCSSISWIVFYYEKKLAIQHSLREFLDDANELRQDATLELSAGVAALLAWAASFYWSDKIQEIYSFISRIMLGGIGVYLAYYGIVSILENFKNLLNPGLDKSTLLELAEHIDLNLPSGCKLVHTNKFPLKTFSRADDLYVFGTFEFDKNLMPESKIIINNIESVIQNYLSDSGKEIIVAFDLRTPVQNGTHLTEESDSILSRIWKLDSKSLLAKPFRIFREGDLAACDSAVQSINKSQLSEKELKLYNWIKCQKTLYIDGPSHPETYKTEQNVIQQYSDESLEPQDTMFLVWRLLRIILSGDLHKEEYRDISKTLVDDIKKIVLADARSESLIAAECAFVLGIYYERSDQYDIDESTKYYKLSERFYYESGFLSEADRLYNSWGHQKTFLYELQEAIALLEKSLKITKQKADKGIIGMSYTMGCLADAYSRLASFDKADKLYFQDLDLIKQAKLQHLECGVLVKRAESLIRRGGWEEEHRHVISGIEICRQVLQQEQRAAEHTFFAHKALVKGLLWLSENTDDKSRVDDWVSESEELLQKMGSFSEYSEAFMLRLKGRISALQGRFQESYKCYTRSEAMFTKMSRGLQFRNSAVQSIACKLESAKVCIMEDSHQIKSMEIALDEFSRFTRPLRGLLGDVQMKYEDVSGLLRKNLKQLEKKKRVSGDDLKKNIIGPVNKLIVLLEG